MEGCEDETTDEYDSPTGEQKDSSIGRRTYLKLAGMAVVSTAATVAETDVARAASDGYGEGGYGEGGYGGSNALAVSTQSASNVSATSVTLNGSLDDLGGADSSTVYFEWRQTGTSTWNTTATQTLSSTGSFSTDLSGLKDGEGYEIRAVAEASDGDTDTGTTVSFTTENLPDIDSYSVTEAGSPNPHLEITADWSVSDVDSDLDSVLIQVYDSSGSLVDDATTEVSGSSATGTNELKIKHVNDQTFDISLTVVDAADNSTSQTRTVTE